MTVTSWKTSGLLPSQRCTRTRVHAVCASTCVPAADCLAETEAARGQDTKASPRVVSVTTLVSQRDFNDHAPSCLLRVPPAREHRQAALAYKKCMCVFYIGSSASKYSVTLVSCTQTGCIYVRARSARGRARPRASCIVHGGQYIRLRQSTSEQLLQVRFITTALGPLLWQWIPYLWICLCVCVHARARVFLHTPPLHCILIKVLQRRRAIGLC